MKRQLLPILAAGLLCEGIGDAQVEERTRSTTTEEQELRVEQPSDETTLQQSESSQFELRQTERTQENQTRESSNARDGIQKIETSPEAAALSDGAQVISLRETPDPVRRHIERQAAFVPLQRIVRQKDGDKTVYEALFVGTQVESKLLFSDAGKPLNMHVTSVGPVVYDPAGAQRPKPRPAPPPEMSQMAVNRLQQQIGNAEIRNIQPRTLYEVTVEANGQAQRIWVAEDGTIMP